VRENLELESTLRVHLHGKGDKWRTCPLWKETAQALIKLLATRENCTPESPVFTARSGLPLTRYGIYKLVRRHTRQFSDAKGGQPQRKISPHVFRHTVCCPSPGVRRGSKRDPGLAGSRRSGDDQPLCGDQPADETESFGSVPISSCERFRNIPRQFSLAGRSGSHEMVEITVTIMWPTCEAPPGKHGSISLLAT
jgi:hypothetical protein